MLAKDVKRTLKQYGFTLAATTGPLRVVAPKDTTVFENEDAHIGIDKKGWAMCAFRSWI